MNPGPLSLEAFGLLVDGLNHPAALAVLSAAFACALIAFVITLIASETLSTSRAVRGLNRSAGRARAPRRVARIAAALAITVEVIESHEVSAFTHGVMRPRISVTNGLIRAMSNKEIEAVLRHERVHLRSMDPTRLVIVQALVAVLSPVPFVKGLSQAYACRREMLADRQAIEEMQNARPLLSALRRAIDAQALVGASARVAGLTQLDVRIDRLAGIRTPLRALVEWPSRRDVAAFSAMLTLVAVLMLASAHSISVCVVQLGSTCGN